MCLRNKATDHYPVLSRRDFMRIARRFNAGHDAKHPESRRDG